MKRERSQLTPPREPPITNVLFVIAGVGAVAVAILRLGNAIDYPPTDPRSEPWFDPLLSSILAILGLLFLVIGVVRIARARRGTRD
jgi:hypothetical protein